MMKKRVLILIFLAMLSAGYSTEKKDELKRYVKVGNIAGNPVKAKESKRNEGDDKMTSDMSKVIKTDEDFYRAVNEKWLNETALPATKPAWGAFTELTEKNQGFTRELVKELKEKEYSDLNEDEKKIVTLYDSYYNVEKRNKIGYAPLKAEMDMINGIKDVKDLENYNIEMTKMEKAYLYGWGVGRDLNSSQNYAVYLTGASTGLAKEYYQKETEENGKILLEYTKYVADLLTYAGEKNSNEKAKKVVEFEKTLAKLHLTNEESMDVKKYNNPRKVSQLPGIVKNIDIPGYLKKSGVDTENVIIDELKYYENMDRVITEKNIETIKDYLKFHLMSSATSLLTDELGQRTFEFYGRYMNGQKEREVLEKRALYFIDDKVGELIGKEYIRKNFSREAKEDTEEMVKYIIRAFRTRVQNLEWMSEETKKKALEKLDKFTVKIGYPDKWHDYSTLCFGREDTLYDQVKKLFEWAYKEDLKKVGKPVDKTEWFMNPHEINAYYSPTGNEIVFPAGILQFPFYDFEKSGPGSNFGAIGVVIGHELTHGFDVSGANFDGDGNVKDWWTENDRKKFESITAKLSEEYSKYQVTPGTFVNGEYTLTENIADLGGVNIAFDALQLYLKEHPEKNVKVNGYSQNQLFFMSFARVWRQKATEEYLKNLVKTDSHSPAYLRVNGTLINVDGFYETFEIRKESNLYKEPEKRIRIW